MDRRIIDFFSYTGRRSGNEPSGYDPDGPNTRMVIGKPVRFIHYHEWRGYDLRCGLCCELRREAARER